jgi:hypothetical protein
MALTNLMHLFCSSCGVETFHFMKTETPTNDIVLWPTGDSRGTEICFHETGRWPSAPRLLVLQRLGVTVASVSRQLYRHCSGPLEHIAPVDRAARYRARQTVHTRDGARARAVWTHIYCTRRATEKLAVLDMLRSRDRAVKLTAMLLVCFIFRQSIPRNALRSSRDEHAYMKGLMQLLK